MVLDNTHSIKPSYSLLLYLKMYEEVRERASWDFVWKFYIATCG